MKLKLKVMNILYFVISAVAIVFLCITPLFKSTIVCHIDKDVIETFIEKGDIDEEAFDEFGIEKDDLFVGDLEFDINVDVTINFATAISAFGKPSERFINDKIVKPMVGPLADELEPVLTQLAMNGINASVRNLFEDELRDFIGNVEDVYPALNEKGFTKDDVNKSVDKIVEQLIVPGQTLNIATDVFVDEYKIYADAFGATAKTFNELFFDMVNPLSYLGIVDDEDNTCLSIEDSICAVLQSFLGEPEGQKEEIEEEDYEDDDLDDAEEAPRKDFVSKLFAPLREGNLEGSELESKLVELIGLNFFGYGYLKVHLFVIFGVFLLALFIAGWLIKIIKIIICFFRKTPYLRVSPFGIATGIIQLGFGIASIIFMLMFKFGPSQWANVPLFGGIYNKAPLGAYYSIEFGTVVASGMVILNALLSLVYNPVKKRFKTEVKKEAESFLDIE